MKSDLVSFLDTNVLIYEHDPRDKFKQDKARELVLSNSSRHVVSAQVLVEFFNTATRKLQISQSDARTLVEDYSRLRIVALSPIHILRAIDTSILYQISIWDAMIVEAAIEGRCDVIYTEDLNHGQTIRGVKIINPFLILSE